jgi:hypothetical protein
MIAAGVQVDSVVTDPPYEIGFMGRAWDTTGVALDPETWRLALQLLKPGGHLLAFTGSRTYHRIACAVEDGGFEIRDQIMWIYGSGFPKSLDVAKSIDKQRGEDLEPVRAVCRYLRAARDTDSQPTLPTWDLDAEVWRLNGRKGTPGDTWASAEILGEYPGAAGGLGGERFDCRDNLIRQTSPDATPWQGWGTALKPAHEPIILARKPLAGTVAATVLAHGTGALNIDACRVGTNDDNARPCGPIGYHGGGSGGYSTGSPAGRFPANLIHDGSAEALACFPDGAGARAPVNNRGADKFRNAYGAFSGTDEGRELHDLPGGSAARFFYCPKASRADRGVGNDHPTVKPRELMRYLVRLVTPPGGLTLDPFGGSGSTGLGALDESFRPLIIEKDEHSFNIACGRIAQAVMEANQ